MRAVRLIGVIEALIHGFQIFWHGFLKIRRLGYVRRTGRHGVDVQHVEVMKKRVDDAGVVLFGKVKSSVRRGISLHGH